MSLNTASLSNRQTNPVMTNKVDVVARAKSLGTIGDEVSCLSSPLSRLPSPSISSKPSVLLPVITEGRLTQFAKGWTSAPFMAPPSWTTYQRSMNSLKYCIDEEGSSESMFDSQVYTHKSVGQDQQSDTTPPVAVVVAAAADHDQETRRVIMCVLESVLKSSDQDSPRISPLPSETDGVREHGNFRIGRVGQSNMYWMLPKDAAQQPPTTAQKGEEVEVHEKDLTFFTPVSKKKRNSKSRQSSPPPKQPPSPPPHSTKKTTTTTTRRPKKKSKRRVYSNNFD